MTTEVIFSASKKDEFLIRLTQLTIITPSAPVTPSTFLGDNVALPADFFAKLEEYINKK